MRGEEEDKGGERGGKPYFPKMHVIYASRRELQAIEMGFFMNSETKYMPTTQSRLLGFMIFFIQYYFTWLNATSTPVLVLIIIG